MIIIIISIIVIIIILIMMIFIITTLTITNNNNSYCNSNSNSNSNSNRIKHNNNDRNRKQPPPSRVALKRRPSETRGERGNQTAHGVAHPFCSCLPFPTNRGLGGKNIKICWAVVMLPQGGGAGLATSSTGTMLLARQRPSYYSYYIIAIISTISL